ncbi:hypothetical protein XarbCFBP8132_20765 [Xanthomonas arboricola]|uniref:hypothetical protein n=1 Tax=Xanthomonas arboricola TaxID=56448 RepID=UPI000CEEA5EA|nr:hypothetical protein [Xanthomonas arboricola]PPT35163.1 hypothetical protein XarbCFBP8132_20765 [Xanthomonas arboricola]
MEDSGAVAATVGQIIVALGGYAVVLAALFAIIGKIWVSRIVERERSLLQRQLDETNKRLQSELDRELHVGKAQFDLELNNYRAIWSCLVDLRTATLEIRPVMDFHDPNETKEERQRRRSRKAHEALVAVQEQVEKNKPFYAPDVYEKARGVIKACHKEAVYSDYTERPHHEYWDEAMKNQKIILAAIEDACVAIRNRVWEARVAS